MIILFECDSCQPQTIINGVYNKQIRINLLFKTSQNTI
jgi:hypothetical protein